MEIKIFFLSSIVFLFFLSNYNFCQELHSTISAPAYAGGFTELENFVQNNLNYSSDLVKDSVTGIVTVRFIVNEKGNIEDIKILRGINSETDSEAIRVVSLIDRFEPAIQFGDTVKVKMLIPIKFKLSNKNEIDFFVTGKITDKHNGKPLKSCLVLLEGTSHGTTSDQNGNYQLKVPNEETGLRFSYIGYEETYERVGKNRTINVELPSEDYIIDFKSD